MIVPVEMTVEIPEANDHDHWLNEVVGLSPTGPVAGRVFQKAEAIWYPHLRQLTGFVVPDFCFFDVPEDEQDTTPWEFLIITQGGKHILPRTGYAAVAVGPALITSTEREDRGERTIQACVTMHSGILRFRVAEGEHGKGYCSDVYPFWVNNGDLWQFSIFIP